MSQNYFDPKGTLHVGSLLAQQGQQQMQNLAQLQVQQGSYSQWDQMLNVYQSPYAALYCGKPSFYDLALYELDNQFPGIDTEGLEVIHWTVWLRLWVAILKLIVRVL